MWKVFCGKQLLNNYPSKIPAPGCVPKGLGHREQGFRMLGAESLGVLESEIHESEIHESGIQARRNQRLGWNQGFSAACGSLDPASSRQR